jgi:hypothetical protein
MGVGVLRHMCCDPSNTLLTSNILQFNKLPSSKCMQFCRLAILC